MKEENKFSLRHIVVALVCAIVGILCIYRILIIQTQHC